MPGSQSQIRSQSRSQLPGFLARGDYGKGLFNTEMGPLQRQLRHGEYDLLKLAPMLESDFLQVNKQGKVIDVHNQVEIMTVAVACTRLLLETPDVLLLARRVFPSEVNLPPFKNLLCQYPPAKAYELTRLLPLRFVKITVHNQKKQQLRFKLANGRAFYLQLCPQPDRQEDLFKLWVKVSPSPIPPPDTVSIRTVYSTIAKPPSPTQDDTRSRRSLSQLSTEGPHVSPIIIQEKTSESGSTPPSDDTGSQEPLERPPSHQDLSPDEEVEFESSPEADRTSKNRRRSSDRSPRRASRRKPSKILSLITSCSWGSQKRSGWESKGNAKGKKR